MEEMNQESSGRKLAEMLHGQPTNGITIIIGIKTPSGVAMSTAQTVMAPCWPKHKIQIVEETTEVFGGLMIKAFEIAESPQEYKEHPITELLDLRDRPMPRIN